MEPPNVSSHLSPPLYPIPSHISEMENRTAIIIGQLQATVTDLVTEVRKMGRKLDNIIQQNPGSNDTSERELALIGMLPIKTIGEFDRLEESLKEVSFHKLLVKVLISLGGRDIKTFTYNILRRLMSSQLATNFSFTGKVPKHKEKERKRPFCCTLLYRSIQASVRKMYPETTDDSLKNYVSLWLQQAKHRLTRREENLENNSEQNGEF